MMNLVPATLTTFLLPLVLFCAWSKADPAKELLCCHGWNDDVANMMVTKHQFSDTPAQTSACYARKQCEGSKCAIEYYSIGAAGKDNDDAHEEKAAVDDCFKWTPGNDPDGSCVCEKNHCNCPDALKNQQPKPKPPGLQCCDNHQDYVTVKNVTCPETALPQPQGCNAKRYREKTIVQCGLGTRFSDNCSEYVANNPDNDLQGRCYCQKDFCNCPLKIPTTTTTTPKSTTKPGNSQVKNYAPKIPFVLFFVLLVALK